MTKTKRVTEIRDLGVIFEEQLSFKRHIEYIVAKAYWILGFIKRICSEFHDIRALKSIYCAHVRSHLEYASMVWQPYCADRIMDLESIQKKFVLYALRRTVKRDEHFPYASKCEAMGIETLARRRTNLSAFFVFDLLKNGVNAPVLRSYDVIFNVPRRELRDHEMLYLNTHRTQYGYYEQVDELCRTFN